MSMGGAPGVIFGSFFRGGSRAIKGETEIELASMARFLAGGLAEVQKRGKAQEGDKTLVDALAPAITCLETAVSNQAPLSEAMKQAAAAAKKGAAGTKEMVAQFGR